MTDFTDQVLIKIASENAPDFYDPNDLYSMVRRIWGFNDGKWQPLGFQDYLNNPNVASYLTFAKPINSPPTQYVDLNLFEVSADGDPLLVIDRGVTIQKDITAGGFVGSNQGELWLGSGRANQLDVPKIILQYSDISMLNGGGSFSLPPIPQGHSGSGSFPSGQPTGTYYLRTDANEPYHNRVFKFDGSNWNDTTPTNTAASQLFRSTDAIFGQAAETIFKSHYTSGTWSWLMMGPASDYAGKYFDTLFLTKLDGSPAHLDVGNLTIHGNITVVGSILNLATQLASVID
jgi:hypothetical protein